MTSRRPSALTPIVFSSLILIASCTDRNVTAVNVSHVEIVPDAVSVAVGESTQLTVNLRDSGGNVLDGRQVRWSSSDATVAEIEADGTVTGVGGGTAVITARIDGVSAQAMVTVLGPPAQTPTPTAPTNLKANRRGQNEIELRWDDNSNNEDSFVLRRSTVPVGVWTYSTTLPAGSTQYLDTGLRPNTRYWYRVEACNQAGCTASNVDSEKTGN